MRTTRRVGILALLAAAAAAPSRARRRQAARPIRFDRLSLEQGLSQAAVMDVLQDRRGYVWLATEDGLNRYDGTAFKVYRHDAADVATLPDSFVWDVEEDGAGSLWIATRGGLGRWDRATDRVTARTRPACRAHPRPALPAQGERALGRHPRQGLLRLDLASGQVRALRARRRRRRQPRRRPRLRAPRGRARTGSGWAPTAGSTC